MKDTILIFRALMKLYPLDFREKFEAEMLQMIEEDLQSAQTELGKMAFWRTVLVMAFAMITNGVSAHWQRLRHRISKNKTCNGALNELEDELEGYLKVTISCDDYPEMEMLTLMFKVSSVMAALASLNSLHRLVRLIGG